MLVEGKRDLDTVRQIRAPISEKTLIGTCFSVSGTSTEQHWQRVVKLHR